MLGVVAHSAGVGEADHGLGGADRSDAGAASEAWSDHVQEVQHLGAVGFQRPGGFAQGEGEPAELTVADSLVWVGRGWAPAPPSPARAVSVRARRAVSRSSSSPVSSSARRHPGRIFDRVVNREWCSDLG